MSEIFKPASFLEIPKYLGERLTEGVLGGAWGDLAETYAGRIAFSDSIREAELTTPSNVIPIRGVGIPDRPNRPRAA